MIITLPKPPGINALYKITCKNGYPSMYKSEEGKVWIQEAGYFLRSQWKRKTITGTLGLHINVFYFGRFDIDSCIKPLLDLFQEMKVIQNDSQIDFLQIRKEHADRRDKQKVEIELIY